MALTALAMILSFSGASGLAATIVDWAPIVAVIAAALGLFGTLITKLVDAVLHRDDASREALLKLVTQLQEEVTRLGLQIMGHAESESLLRREVSRLRQRVDQLNRVLVTNGIPVPQEEQ